MPPWAQPLAPLHSLAGSALVAAIPLAVVLVLMAGLRRGGAFVSACGLASAVLLAVLVWGMPARLAAWSVAFGLAYAVVAILWLVFAALWLYNLSRATGSFEALRAWMARHASDDPAVAAILVAFCFGALLEGSAGFGAPVAVTAFLLLRLGFAPHRAVLVALLANTAPVAFGGLGVPIVALSGVTGLDIMRLSAMAGRQLPVLSLVLPAYLALVVAGRAGLARAWPAALVAGASFATAQFLVSNLWGPWATDILSALASLVATVAFLRWRAPGSLVVHADTSTPAPAGGDFAAWLPWVTLSVVMVAWSWFRLFSRGQVAIPIPALHEGVLLSLYAKRYAAVLNVQPLGAGSAVVVATMLSAAGLRARPRVVLASAGEALRQLVRPGLTALLIVALAYVYNYSGMAYTLGAALASVGPAFPLASSFLGWIACFLSGSDTSANLLFGNLQVAAASRLGIDPVLLAATNSSGAVAGKMISPQNIAVGVTTVGLVGEEGKVLRAALGHSVAMAAFIGVVALLQAYWLRWMIP